MAKSLSVFYGGQQHVIPVTITSLDSMVLFMAKELHISVPLSDANGKIVDTEEAFQEAIANAMEDSVLFFALQEDWEIVNSGSESPVLKSNSLKEESVLKELPNLAASYFSIVEPPTDALNVSQLVTRVSTLTAEKESLTLLLKASELEKTTMATKLEKAFADQLEETCKLAQQNGLISSQASAITSLNKNVEFLNSRIAILEFESEQYRKETALISKELCVPNSSNDKSLHDIVASHMITITTLQKQVHVYENEIKLLQKQVESQNSSLNSLKSQLCETESSYLTKLMEAQQQIDQAKGEVRDESTQHKATLKSLEARNADLQRQVEELTVSQATKEKFYQNQVSQLEAKEKDAKKSTEALRSHLQSTLLSHEAASKKSEAMFQQAGSDYAKLKTELESLRKQLNEPLFRAAGGKKITIENFQSKDFVLLIQGPDGKSYKPISTDKNRWSISQDTLDIINLSYEDDFAAMWSKCDPDAPKSPISALPRIVLASVIHVDGGKDSRVLSCEIITFFK